MSAVTAPASPASRTTLLPAVMQVRGYAPRFGVLSYLADQGLLFDCESAAMPAESLGQTARIEFWLSGEHHGAGGRILHVQGLRLLISQQNLAPELIDELQTAGKSNHASRATGRRILQIQQVCHARFMDGMKAVINAFYQQLDACEPGAHPAIALQAIKGTLHTLRAQLTRQLTQTYPIFPQQTYSLADSPTELSLVDLSDVDHWIRRTTLVQNLTEPYKQTADIFSLNYARLLQKPSREATHPYQLESVLNVLDELLSPYALSAAEQTFCYQLMGRVFAEHAPELYRQLLKIVGKQTQPDQGANAALQHIETPPVSNTANLSLAQWLKTAASDASHTEYDSQANTSPAGEPASAACQLADLLVRLTDNLSILASQAPANKHLPQNGLSPANPGDTSTSDLASLIPGLIARDRILGHFLPEATAPASALPVAVTTENDIAAFRDLQAYIQQPPPIDAGPERLTQASQIRALMLQAQGLLLEYTLNGLTYQSQPDHPAWQLLNALDALHMGADNRGQFLDQTLHQAVRLSMQWLLEQEDADTALLQVNNLLARINRQLAEERQTRRTQHLNSLGDLVHDDTLFNSAWCVVRLENDIVPYEILGKREQTWMLLDRSASDLLEIPADQLESALNAGDIQETPDYDAPYLERIAGATLTASLQAVHAYTWQDTASGCLKRNALMDELERRLMHPVSSPASYCALIEIPGMRPGMIPVQADELTILQKRTGDLLHNMRLPGEQCGRLSDIAFMLIFAPQDGAKLKQRLATLKQEMEALHPQWKMLGAAVPLVVPDEATPSPASVLRRANIASASQRQISGFDLSALEAGTAAATEIIPLPFSALYLRAQKIAPCHADALPHYEILLGVSDELVPAHTTQSFVVMAEQGGRVHELDAWVLQNALLALSENPALSEQISGLSINLSGASLANPAHANNLLEILSAHTRLAEKIIVEVTETAAIENLDRAVHFLRKLRQLGLRVALDDFGSGYSSYAYLRKLPLDYLKIDGTYIRNIVTDKTDQALTASMVDVAHALGLKVIAEFVDNEAAYQLLKEMDVDYVQGYWVHKPQQLEQLLVPVS